jgi:hypothetical protein
MFYLVKNIDSDNGSHFTANIIKNVMKGLDIDLKNHILWHPPSSGKVE